MVSPLTHVLGCCGVHVRTQRAWLTLSLPSTCRRAGSYSVPYVQAYVVPDGGFDGVGAGFLPEYY